MIDATLTTPASFTQIDDNAGTSFSGFNAMSVYDGDAQTERDVNGPG